MPISIKNYIYVFEFHTDLCNVTSQHQCTPVFCVCYKTGSCVGCATLQPEFFELFKAACPRIASFAPTGAALKFLVPYKMSILVVCIILHWLSHPQPGLSELIII